MKKLFPLIFLFSVSVASLCHAQNPVLCGMTNYDGAVGDGDIFKVTLTGTVTDIHNFGTGTDGQYPWGSLVRANNGLLYGMTENGGKYSDGMIFSYNSSTGSYIDLHDFNFAGNDGLFPLGSLIQAGNGKLYGMTQNGGANGGGIIFSYDILTSTYSNVYNFSVNNNPQGSFIQASNNLLYGMTQFGGSNGDGIIFSFNSSTNTFTDQYDFKGGTTDGKNPLLGSLLQASDGLLYGMTSGGGINNGPHSGTMFSYNILTGQETVLHNFGSGSDGSFPEGSLIQAGNGLLYGMASYGGTNTYYGIIFNYNIATGSYTDVHDFGAGTDGQDPNGDVIQASNGLLYGMTREGGVNSNGIIFTYNTSTAGYNDIHDFSGNDGAYPYGSLIEVDSVSVTSSKENICGGDTVLLRANGATTYTWTPSTALSATTGDSVTAHPTQTTTYTIIGTTGNANDTITVTVTVTDAGISTNMPPPICNGQSTTLTAAGAVIYTWAPSTGLSATTGDSVVSNPAVTTIYSISGASSDGCLSTTTDTLNVNPALPIIIRPISPSICSGQKITLVADTTGTNYTWSPDTGISATTGDSVVAKPADDITYTVTGIDSVGCLATGTDVVTVGHGPNKPTIKLSVTGDTLFSSAQNGNQWYKNGQLISGATDSFLVITGLPVDTYNVVVINQANGCGTSSDSLVMSGIEQLLINNYQLSIYPNPTNGLLNVNISPAAVLKDWNLQLTNLLGQILYTKSSLKYSNEINLSALPGGIYYITILNINSRVVFPIVKED